MAIVSAIVLLLSVKVLLSVAVAVVSEVMVLLRGLLILSELVIVNTIPISLARVALSIFIIDNAPMQTILVVNTAVI